MKARQLNNGVELSVVCESTGAGPCGMWTSGLPVQPHEFLGGKGCPGIRLCNIASRHMLAGWNRLARCHGRRNAYRENGKPITK
jgi:hypothetical protein